jgi:hypothetical protein
MLNLSSETEYAIRIAISVVIYLGLFTAVSCSSPELKSNAQIVKTPVVQVSNTPEVKDESEQAARKLTELYDNKNCKEFFNVFPNTFQKFNHLYGYDDEEGERMLFAKSKDHISYFFSCSEVSDLEKLDKAIKIGINGKWEADAVWMFQESSFKLIKDHPNEAKEILDKLSDEKAASFWYFLFDGPHPSDKENKNRVDLLSNVLGKNSKQSKLLLEQYKKLLVDWSEH